MENVRLLESLLRRNGYQQVTCITEPREALQLVQSLGPDIILLDLNMPVLDGFAVLEQLKGWIGGDDFLPVLILTADASPDARDRALSHGASDFLTKPFDVTEVLLRIGNLLRTRALHQSLRERNRSLEGQLFQAQKMEAIGRLAGGIAHDFNTLLTVIIGHCQVLQRDLDPDGDTAKRIGKVRDAGDKAARIVRQLLAFGRRQALSPGIHRLTEIVAGVTPVLEHIAGDRASLVVQAGADPLPVHADPTQVEQVLINLVSNGRDAMPAAGGTITIHLERLRIGEDDPRPVPPGEWVTVSVADTGAGISDSAQRVIFEPFYTTKGPGQGTGLGLSIVYGIVAQSGGHITVDSAPGRGTRFTIYLRPVSEGRERVPSSAAGGDATLPAAGAHRILVVIEEPSMRALVRRMLATLGHAVMESAGGHDVPPELLAFASGVDLLVTDDVLVTAGDSPFAPAFAARRPSPPVLCIAARSDFLPPSAHGGGAIVELISPFTPTQLVLGVTRALESGAAAYHRGAEAVRK